MSSGGSIASSSPRIRQFGLYRTIDSKTDEFIRSSRKRQITQGCACAAISTAITVTVVVSIILVYEYSINVDSNDKKISLNANWLGLVNESESTVVDLKDTKSNFDRKTLKFLPVLLKALNDNSYSDKVVNEYSSSNSPYDRTINQENYVKRNIFSNANNWLKLPSSKLLTVDPKTTPLIYIKRPSHHIEYLDRLRKMKNYQRMLNYFDKMINGKITDSKHDIRDKAEHEYTEKLFKISTKPRKVNRTKKSKQKSNNHKSVKNQNVIKQQTQKAKKNKNKANVNCACPKDMGQLLNKLIIKLQDVIPHGTNHINAVPCPNKQNSKPNVQNIQNVTKSLTRIVTHHRTPHFVAKSEIKDLFIQEPITRRYKIQSTENNTEKTTTENIERQEIIQEMATKTTVNKAKLQPTINNTKEDTNIFEIQTEPMKEITIKPPTSTSSQTKLQINKPKTIKIQKEIPDNLKATEKPKKIENQTEMTTNQIELEGMTIEIETDSPINDVYSETGVIVNPYSSMYNTKIKSQALGTVKKPFIHTTKTKPRVFKIVTELPIYNNVQPEVQTNEMKTESSINNIQSLSLPQNIEIKTVSMLNEIEIEAPNLGSNKKNTVNDVRTRLIVPENKNYPNNGYFIESQPTESMSTTGIDQQEVSQMITTDFPLVYMAQYISDNKNTPIPHKKVKHPIYNKSTSTENIYPYVNYLASTPRPPSTFKPVLEPMPMYEFYDTQHIKTRTTTPYTHNIKTTPITIATTQRTTTTTELIVPVKHHDFDENLSSNEHFLDTVAVLPQYKHPIAPVFKEEDYGNYMLPTPKVKNDFEDFDTTSFSIIKKHKVAEKIDNNNNRFKNNMRKVALKSKVSNYHSSLKNREMNLNNMRKMADLVYGPSTEIEENSTPVSNYYKNNNIFESSTSISIRKNKITGLLKRIIIPKLSGAEPNIIETKQGQTNFGSYQPGIMEIEDDDEKEEEWIKPPELNAENIVYKKSVSVENNDFEKQTEDNVITTTPSQTTVSLMRPVYLERRRNNEFKIDDNIDYDNNMNIPNNFFDMPNN